MNRRYFKRRWNENRGDQFDHWGHATYYFEIDDQGHATRQIEDYDNGPLLKYGDQNSQDKYGRLANGVVIGDMTEWAGLQISQDEFAQQWMSNPERFVTAWWGPLDKQSVVGLTAAALDHLLDALEIEALNRRPLLVDITDDGGNVLTIGLGHPATVLLFMDGSDDPSYLTSIIEHGSETASSIWFDYSESESEFGPEQIVEKATAREVVRSFVASGDRSGVAWAEA